MGAQAKLAAAVIVLAVVALAAWAALFRPRPPPPGGSGGSMAGVQAALRPLYGRVAALLDGQGVPHWPMGGTLLGAVRHGDFIPWDDDVDIGIWEEDIGAAAAVIRGDPGLLWWERARCFKVTTRDRFDTVVDVFPMRREAGGRVVFANPLAREEWPQEFFDAGEFGGGGRAFRFGALELRGPEAPCPYLDRSYPGWDRRGLDEGGHAASGLRRTRGRLFPRVYTFDPAKSRRRCGPGGSPG